MAGDPSRPQRDRRLSNGLTAQENVDAMQTAGNPPHPASNTAPQPKAPGPSIHPVAKGVYGAPIQAPILK